MGIMPKSMCRHYRLSPDSKELAMPPTVPLLTWQSLILHLRTPFRVSYGASTTRQAFWLRLAGDSGWGEGTIPPYYGVDEAAMIDFWQATAARPDPLRRRLRPGSASMVRPRPARLWTWRCTTASAGSAICPYIAC